MSLALAEVQTPLLELLHSETYVIQEMQEARVVETAARDAYRALLVNQPRSIRAAMLRDQFRAALARWHKETEISSLLDEKRKHPAYRQIIGMGEEVIPLILEAIDANPSFIFMALQDITGKNPVPEEHRGRLTLMVGDWLR